MLIRGWGLINFSPFSTSVVCIICNKTVNGNNKTRRCNNTMFLQNILKKTPSSEKSLVSTCSSFGGGRGKGVGAYVRFSGSGRVVGWGWALIRGWALLKFFYLQDGRLFEVGANSRLGAYSNKYGMKKSFSAKSSKKATSTQLKLYYSIINFFDLLKVKLSSPLRDAKNKNKNSRLIFPKKL